MTATVVDYALKPRVTAYLEEQRKLFINGAFVDSASDEEIPVLDPSTGAEIARVPSGNATDIDRAVAAARAAFDSGPWSTIKPTDRAKLIWKLADLLEEHAEELAELESLDNGKPKKAALEGDVAGSIEMFRYFSGWATKIEGTQIPFASEASGNYLTYTNRVPVGVVGQIIPWNYPLMMIAWKFAPALAVGCTIVLKPAEQTPLSALYVAKLVQEAGFPDGVINIVTGDGETAGAALAAHPQVDKVAFTGSTEVGRLIVQAAAGNLKKVSLELGGKSPNIVLPDADLDVTIPGAADAIFNNHGQDCSAGSRLFVHKSHFDKVVGGVVDKAKEIRLGPGLDPDTDMGPLVSDEQLNRVVGYLQSGVDNGARTLSGGKRRGDQGYFVEPTVFVDTKPSMSIVQEEIFGPVVAAIPFDDLDDLVATANNTTYGLAAGIWTTNLSKAHSIASKLRAGSVWINCYGVTDPAVPFGGFKQSGWGREMGHEVLELYTETRAVTVAL